MVSKREKRRRDFLRARQWFLGRKKKTEQAAEPSVSSEGAIAEDDDDNPTYDEATACRILREEVLVLASRSDNGEAVVGFDPDDAALDNHYRIINEYYQGWSIRHITPIIYYIYKKDVKMVRYLASRGASTTKADDSRGEDFPMLAAAYTGQLEIVKFLYENGARNDIRNKNRFGTTPFFIGANGPAWSSDFVSPRERDDLLRWIVLHGGLIFDDVLDIFSDVDSNSPPETLRQINTSEAIDPCKRLFEWAKGVTQTHSALVTFLVGALPPNNASAGDGVGNESDNELDGWSVVSENSNTLKEAIVRLGGHLDEDMDQGCVLQALSGCPGVRKHIGVFVGLEVKKRTELDILRNMAEVTKEAEEEMMWGYGEYYVDHWLDGMMELYVEKYVEDDEPDFSQPPHLWHNYSP